MRKPQLTPDEHLHSFTAEQVYRIHHGLDPETGKELRGVEVSHDECGCAHCVSFVEKDEKVLAEAQENYVADKAAAASRPKKSKQRRG